jgi:hypothetical protein
MLHFAELMEQGSANGTAKERADSEWKKSETHVGALLACRSEPGNVFVVTGLLNKFADSHDHQGGVDGPHAGM